MSVFSGTNPLGTTGSSAAANASSALNDVNLDDFLKLMIAELQNQDPLNPLENDELVAQISQIRSVGATDKLTATLDSVLLGQNIASATNLIGAEIDGLSDDGQGVTGLVERVSVKEGQPKLHLSLMPNARPSSEEGEIEKGTYQYLVTWEDKGKLYALDPLVRSDGSQGSIAVSGVADVDRSVQISNLPVTTGEKQVYRRKGDSGPFYLVGQITDGKQARFLDTAATDTNALALNATATIVTSRRTFDVSLKNVSEIRPPE